MVQKGTYTEFLKSGVDFGSLLKKENEEADESPAPGSPALRTRSFSESSVWSQQSSRPSLKDGALEVQAVSSPLAACPGPVCSQCPHASSFCSARDLFIGPIVDSKVPRPCSMDLVELEQNEGSRPDQGSPLGVGWRMSRGCKFKNHISTIFETTETHIHPRTSLAYVNLQCVLCSPDRCAEMLCISLKNMHR